MSRNILEAGGINCKSKKGKINTHFFKIIIATFIDGKTFYDIIDIELGASAHCTPADCIDVIF